MTAIRTSALPRVVAALLVLVVTLAGVGRGLAAAADRGWAPAPGASAGFPICHAGMVGEEAPTAPQPHACCDACALSAAGIMPVPMRPSEPVAVTHAAAHAVALAGAPALARARTPRQAQGPPAA